MFLKPYFCKLKKQQCIPRSATCWAQRVDTQVDWPNSFWDMTKCFWNLIFANWRNNSVFRASATCWAQRVDTQVDWPNSFWDMTKCFWNLIFANWRNNSVFRAALPAEHNALTLRSIGPIVSEIWQNVFETLFLQIEETTVYSAQRYLLSTTRWHSGRLAQ